MIWASRSPISFRF